MTLGLAALSFAGCQNEGLRPRLALLWGLLGIQVVLGGLTVLLQLAPWTVTVHLIVGNAFCAALLWTAADLRERAHGVERAPLPGAVRAGVIVLACIVALQLLLGGLVSSLRLVSLAPRSLPATVSPWRRPFTVRSGSTFCTASTASYCPPCSPGWPGPHAARCAWAG